MSLGRQDLAKNDSSGLQKRRIGNQPRPSVAYVDAPSKFVQTR